MAAEHFPDATSNVPSSLLFWQYAHDVKVKGADGADVEIQSLYPRGRINFYNIVRIAAEQQSTVGQALASADAADKVYAAFLTSLHSVTAVDTPTNETKSKNAVVIVRAIKVPKKVPRQQLC